MLNSEHKTKLDVENEFRSIKIHEKYQLMRKRLFIIITKVIKDRNIQIALNYFVYF